MTTSPGSFSCFSGPWELLANPEAWSREAGPKLSGGWTHSLGLDHEEGTPQGPPPRAMRRQLQGAPRNVSQLASTSPAAGYVVAPLRVRGNLGGAACSVRDEGPGEGTALVPMPTLYPAPTPSHLVLTLTPELRSPFYR